MNRIRRTLWPVLAMAAGMTTACTDSNFVGVYFVKLKAEPAEVVALADEIAREVGAEPLHVFDAATAGFTLRLPHLAAPELERIEVVEYVILDTAAARLPPDTTGWPVSEVDPREVPVSVQRVGGPLPWVVDWDDVEVAVVDTGIDPRHPDLNVVAQVDFVAMSGGDRAGSVGDPVGHGTHVAGIIGARDNGSGIVGLAPGVPLHDLRVLGADGSGYSSDILAAADYILDNPHIRVANFSLGGPAGSAMDRELDQAFQRLEDAGVVVVVAAGNESSPVSTSSPAAFDIGLVVSAYNAAAGDRGFASFSNYGDEVDLAAPGVAVRSTWPGGGEAELDGTSMATPHVAGAAAGFAALYPSSDVQDIYDALLDNAETGLQGQNKRHSEPLLDALGAWQGR
jgi:subtilisin family serine protease